MKKVSYGLLLVAGLTLLVFGSWIQIKAEMAQWLLNNAWSRTKIDGEIHKPWSWADHWPVARLKVAGHGIEQIVLAGDSGNVLAFAPGLNTQLAFPGQDGTVVISGHRDTHFSFLKDLKNGDTIEIELPNGQVIYKVRKNQVVDSSRFALNREADASQLLLVTCYPFDAITTAGPLRYLVTADRIML